MVSDEEETALWFQMRKKLHRCHIEQMEDRRKEFSLHIFALCGSR
jgi:hypothetical protein